MYAVLSKGCVAYLGDDRDKALETLESKDDATLKQVSTLASLAIEFDKAQQSTTGPTPEEELAEAEEVLSEALDSVLDRLDRAGMAAGDVIEKVKEDGQSALAEVKSLGVRGMSAVGASFVAIGDLLQKAGAEDESPSADAEDKTETANTAAE